MESSYPMATDCNHVLRVKIDDYESLCVRCLERIMGKNNYPNAPRGWQGMVERDSGELAVWYAQMILKADLSGHGKVKA
jgi:hypothetical protein